MLLQHFWPNSFTSSQPKQMRIQQSITPHWNNIIIESDVEYCGKWFQIIDIAYRLHRVRYLRIEKLSSQKWLNRLSIISRLKWSGLTACQNCGQIIWRGFKWVCQDFNIAFTGPNHNIYCRWLFKIIKGTRFLTINSLFGTKWETDKRSG